MLLPVFYHLWHSFSSLETFYSVLFKYIILLYFNRSILIYWRLVHSWSQTFSICYTLCYTNVTLKPLTFFYSPSKDTMQVM